MFDLDGTVVALIGKQGGEKQVNGGDLDTGQAAFDTMIAIQHGRENQSDPSDVWENRGAEPGEFRYPVSADVGPDGTLYVSDQMNFRVQAFDREGRFLRQFGGLGKMPGSFARPKGVAVDANGHIYVVDAAFNNVQVFNRDGSLLIVFGSLGHGEGEHWLPLGISVDESNRIYVADRFNNRTQVYEYLEPPSEDGESGSNATGS